MGGGNVVVILGEEWEANSNDLSLFDFLSWLGIKSYEDIRNFNRELLLDRLELYVKTLSISKENERSLVLSLQDFIAKRERS
ncbi:MAG: hypothetical protein ACKVTZ_01120, partial [Bacteroidia bacterium]